MGSRTWIKIYCDRWLNGSIREETPEVRGIWVDLLVLAGSGKYGDSGEIKITDQVGFLDQQLADLLQISVQKWVACKKKLIETDRVCIKNRNIVTIVNWSKYQSEYRRQKPYREGSNQIQGTIDDDPENSNQKLQQQVTEDTVTKSTPREERGERGEGRLEIIDKENTPSLSNLSPSKEDVIEFYRENFGEPSEDMENELKLACIKFSPEWVVDAIKEAVKRGKKDWRYIARILENWRRFGKNTKSKQDPDKYVKGKYGSSVRR